MPRHSPRTTHVDPNDAFSSLPEIYQLQKLLLRAIDPPLPSMLNASHIGLSSYLQLRVRHGVVEQRSPSSSSFENDLSLHPHLRSSYQTHRSNSHASIHVLPSEILGEIFMFCADTVNDPPSPFNLPLTRHPPMLMCQVCRYWRALMLSMSMIWSSLSTMGRRFGQNDLRLYKMWLGRSRLAPLWLSISEPPERYSSDFHSVDAIFSLFISEIHRWRFVRLELETQHLFDHFLAIPNNAASTLNGLGLRVPRESKVEGRLSTLLSTISKFPALQQFSLAVAPRPPSMTDIPWQRMTHIKISASLLASDCLDILARCTLAIDVFFGHIKRESTETTSDSISLPYLRSMTIVVSCDPALLLRHLTLPVLTRMEINDHQYGHFRDHAVFEKFLRRTPQLKHLVIDDIFCWDDQILAYLNMGAVQCVPDVNFIVSERKYYSLRARPDMRDKNFKVGPFGLHYYVGWTSQPDIELGDDLPRGWKRAFWDH